MPNSSSKRITSSTVSSESAPRSSMKRALGVTSFSSTPSSSTMICLTFCSISGSGINFLLCEWLETSSNCSSDRDGLAHFSQTGRVFDVNSAHVAVNLSQQSAQYLSGANFDESLY